MGKLTSNKGFLLVDLCVTILIISVMTILYLPCIHVQNIDGYLFGDTYLEAQSRAIKMRRSLELPEEPIIFNDKGNVNRAMTLQKGNREIVVELGGGRLVYK
jgi:hypothetical protein